MKHLKNAAVLTLAICVALTIFTACGKKKSESPDVHEVCRKITEKLTLPDMKEIRYGDDNAKKGFSSISDLDYDKVEDFDLLYASDGSSYEIAVIKLKDESDSKALERSLNNHLERRATQYRYYDPDQLPRVEKAVISVSGSYAALLMCDDPAAAETAFEKAVQ